MSGLIDSFELRDAAGQVIGRAEGSRDRKGEPTIRILRADGKLHALLSGGEVQRLGEMIRRLGGGRK